MLAQILASLVQEAPLWEPLQGGLIIVGFTDDIDALGFIGYVDSIAVVITL